MKPDIMNDILIQPTRDSYFLTFSGTKLIPFEKCGKYATYYLIDFLN